MNKFKLISNFILVARNRSITAAAKEAKVTVSALSKQMTELERDLGAVLLLRTKQEVSLTAAGKRYLDEVLPLFKGLAQAEEAVRRLSSEPEGALRVGVSKTLGTFLVAPNLEGFCDRFPRLSVSLVDYGRDEDVAVHVGPGRPGGNGETHLLGAQEWAALVASDSPQRFATEPGELAAPFVSWDEGAPVKEWNFQNGGRPVKYDLWANRTSSEVERLLLWIEDGRGVALMPLWLAVRALRSGRFTRVLPHWSIQPVGREDSIMATVPPSKSKLATVSSFVRHMQRTLEDMSRSGLPEESTA